MRKTIEVVLGVVVVVTIVALSISIFFGAIYIASYVTSALALVSIVAFIVNLLIALPMTFIRKTRNLGAAIMFFSSYVFGLFLWGTSAITAFVKLGKFWFGVGTFMAGFGVTPLAIIAHIISGSWADVMLVLFLVFLTLGSRVYALRKSDYPGELNA